SEQAQYFAPVFGGGNNSTVHTEATAIWGPSLSADVPPIMVQQANASGNCDLNNLTPASSCAFWFDSNNLGDSSWGFLNLDQWNVPSNASCPNAGNSNLTTWIGSGVFVTLNPSPPTYVCVSSGNKNSS